MNLVCTSLLAYGMPTYPIGIEMGEGGHKYEEDEERSTKRKRRHMRGTEDGDATCSGKQWVVVARSGCPMAEGIRIGVERERDYKDTNRC